MRHILLACLLLGCSAGAPSPDPALDPIVPTSSHDSGAPGDTSDDDDDDDGPDRLFPPDLITPVPYEGLRVQIDWVTGRRPNAQALNLLRSRLDDLLAGGQIVKPGGVQVVLDEEVAPLGDEVHTFAELDAKLKSHAGPPTDGDTAVIHALYVDGRFAGDQGNSRVLGFAYGGSYTVLLADNLAEACERHLGIPLLTPVLAAHGCRTAEATVLVHEIGHLFGLVNNGLEMVQPHEDPDHSLHDSDNGCVMYWAVERSELLESVLTGLLAGDDAVKPFDAACLADMAAAQPDFP